MSVVRLCELLVRRKVLLACEGNLYLLVELLVNSYLVVYCRLQNIELLFPLHVIMLLDCLRLVRNLLETLFDLRTNQRKAREASSSNEVLPKPHWTNARP